MTWPCPLHPGVGHLLPSVNKSSGAQISVFLMSGWGRARAIDTDGRAEAGAYLRGPAPRATHPTHNLKEKIKNAKRLRADYQFFFQELRGGAPTPRPPPVLTRFYCSSP